MAIDTSIYAQYAPKLRSVTDYLAEMDDQEQRKQTLQQNRLALMMNQGKLDDDMRTRQEMGVVRNALTRLAPTATDEDRLTALRNTNTVTGWNQAAALAKELAAARQQKLLGDKSAFELAKGRFDTYRRTLGVLADTPNLTKPMALQAAQDLVSQGIIDQQMFDAGAATLSDDPAQLRLQLRQGLASQASPDQILTMFGPKPTVVDGRVVDLNPRSQTYGQTTVQRQPNMAQDLLIPGADGQMVPNQKLIAAKAAAAPKTVIDMTGGQKGFDNERNLRKDFAASPAAKAYDDMVQAHAQVRVSIDQVTPIGDTAAGTKIMKLLDPGSVVRETELAMAMEASGMMDRLRNYVQLKKDGLKLTPTQREDFLRLSDGLLDAAAEAYNKARGEYAAIGTEYGINADRALGPAKTMVSKPKKAKDAESKKAPDSSQDLQSAAQAELERRRLAEIESRKRSAELTRDYDSGVLGLGTRRVEGRVTPMEQ